MATENWTVERHNRRTRRFHAATYVVTFVLLVTGWWLWAGNEGRPSLLARLVDEPDTQLHRRAGYGLAALGVGAITLGVRAALTFVRHTLRVDRTDWRWFVSWPVGALRGRFARHGGRFDPGQRIANIAFVASFVTLIVTGIGLTTLHGGATFAALAKLHRTATYWLTALVVVHVVVAAGVLPGYRGVWRSMHGRGQVPVATARRLWPATVADDDVDDVPKPAA